MDLRIQVSFSEIQAVRPSCWMWISFECNSQSNSSTPPPPPNLGHSRELEILREDSPPPPPPPPFPSRKIFLVQKLSARQQILLNDTLLWMCIVT